MDGSFRLAWVVNLSNKCLQEIFRDLDKKRPRPQTSYKHNENVLPVAKIPPVLDTSRSAQQQQRYVTENGTSVSGITAIQRKSLLADCIAMNNDLTQQFIAGMARASAELVMLNLGGDDR